MLVAHDAPVVVRTFALVLERHGLAVLGAHHSDDALQSVAEHDPAIVFVHPALPGFDEELPRALGLAGASVFLLGDDLPAPYEPSRLVALMRSALGSDGP